MRRLFRSTAIAGMLSALIGCRDTTAPDRDLADAALINLAISSMSVISVTEIPKAGRPFEVRVQSYGLDGCWVLDRSVVVSDESGATITPYNRRDAAPTGACTDAIVAIPHRVISSNRHARDIAGGRPWSLAGLAGVDIARVE